jgi:phosphatidylglycerol:prolipoprotein diacylglycerol transferase
MWQVLFRIPFTFFGRLPEGIPIYGFGVMLFIAFVVCTWLAGRRALRMGIPPQAYYLVYYFQLRPRGISNWKMADIIAPAIALGLFFGRIGCFLTGCCYGNIACANVPQVHFPLAAMLRIEMTQQGFQTAAGFTWANELDKDDRTVGAVEADSPAAKSGLHPGDIIIKADDKDIRSSTALDAYLVQAWPRGKNDIQLSVKRGSEVVDLPAFVPRTIGLHPAQLYSSIGGLIVFLLLMAYDPFRRHDGELMALLMLTLPVLRFFEEAIRVDTPVLADGMTFSQNVSILFFLMGIGLAFWLSRRPAISAPKLAVANA